ncbi:hypothetical protein BMW26_14370 [Microbacterium sp. 1.5R]|nr:hypothetical protein BMW26_14370 [Microbacterium sp. 1.5R]
MSAYNSDTGSVIDVAIDFTTPLQDPYADCPGPPEVAAFSSHGLSVQERDGKMTLLAVNHGGRESVEVFDVDMTGSVPSLGWKGCAELPGGKVANSVAAYGDDRFLATVPQDAGLTTGAVYAWAPTTGWDRIDALEFDGNNGILVSPDERTVYIAEWSSQRVTKASIDGSTAPTESADLGFLPDNLRFAPDGTILAAGQQTSPLLIAGLCNGTSIEVCPATSAVAQLDSETLTAERLVEIPRSKTFGGATSAIMIGDDLLVSSFRAPAILRIPLDALPIIRG